jgi:hypothetical protein
MFTVVEVGKRPPKAQVYPGKEAFALWRGLEAGGNSEGKMMVEGTGRLPNDDDGRPSTLPG